MPIQLTLRFRIISLITLFAIALIAVFTALLLTRQLAVATENAQYRARIGTFTAKGAFERILLLNRETDPTRSFQELIPLLQEGQLTEEVTVADLNWKIIAAGKSSRIGSTLSEAEISWADYACKTYTRQSWFHARVNPENITISLPITIDQVPQYVAVLRYSLGSLRTAFRQIDKLCIVVAIGVVCGVIPLCLLLIRAILGPIKILNEATKDVASGNLTREVHVSTEDELGELAETFNEMTSALVQLKERAENANPLTKLPGNNVIHEEIDQRIKKGTKFVAVYLDIDNFKAFNDKYGIAAGDQAIQLTAQILREVMKRGSPTDFLGHGGGDDFMLLTTPERAGGVTAYICTEFDKRIKELYKPEDRANGYILSTDREGNTKQFPLMTVSLAGVSNAHRVLTSYAEVTNICAEVKRKAKEISKTSGKSSYFLDRRTGQRGPAETSKQNG